MSFYEAFGTEMGTPRRTPDIVARSISPTQRWTTENECEMRKTQHMAQKNAWMYKQLAATSKRYIDNLNIISGTAGGLVGTSGLVSVSSDSPSWIKVSQTVIGFIILLVSVVISAWRLDEVYSKSLAASSEYQSLYNSISLIASQPLSERPDAMAFLGEMFEFENRIRKDAPLLTKKIEAAGDLKYPIARYATSTPRTMGMHMINMALGSEQEDEV